MNKITFSRQFIGKDVKLLKDYNSASFTFFFIRVTIGRPFTVWYNRTVQAYHQTLLYYALQYYRTLKLQVNLDLLFTSGTAEDVSKAYKEFDANEQRRQWTLNMDIAELELYLPVEVKRYINKRVERYYEKRFLKVNGLI